MDKPGDLNFDPSKYAWRPDVDNREHPGLYSTPASPATTGYATT